MDEVKFPYKAAVDGLEEVGAKESYSLSLDLTRQGIVCGPSSGFTLQGLFQRLEKKKQDGTLSQLAGPNGDINCVFICSDLPYQYLNEYFQNLGPEKFSPLKNEVRQKASHKACRRTNLVANPQRRGFEMSIYIDTMTLGREKQPMRWLNSSPSSQLGETIRCFRLLLVALRN